MTKPEIITEIERFMKNDVAGDPITGLKWCRKTLGKIAEKLELHGINVSGKSVGTLLKKMGFSLRVNQKIISSGGKSSQKRKR